MAFLEDLQAKKWFPWTVLGTITLGLGWLLWPSAPSQPPVRSVPVQEQKEKLYDLKTTPWQSRVDQDLEATKKQIAEVDKNQAEIKEQLKGISDMLANLAKEKKEEEEQVKAGPREQKRPVSPQLPPEQKTAAGAGITVHRFEQPKGPEPQRPRDLKSTRQLGKPSAYLPGGSMARSVLLTGIDAPVGGKPFPVLLALKEAFTAPNSYRVPLKNCFALGKAEGNISSERADIQVVRISCVLTRGKAFEQEVTGYLVGDDGKQGIPGKLVEKQGQKIALAALAGVGSGLARAFGQQEVTNVVTESGAITSTVTGDALRFGVSEGARGAADELRRFFEKQAEKLVPIVEVDAGKNVTLIMLSGVKVPGLQGPSRANLRRGLD
ncbi:MAG: TraB/VirB10 family protein [Deltaproteobacteria bacterium]|nr:TraB/VirB10 family protein [Deltaproteobacteria bacterium]